MLFSGLARLRATSFIFLLAPLVYSMEEVIFTSSVTYCNPPETLLIEQFDIIYFASNQSVFFNISAASVQANVNVTANLFLNVYGLKPINYTINLCDMLGGALCPLPMYNFTGADTLSLPTSLGIAGRIPSIAFKIPDLEGFAQLTLTEVGTGNIKACIQATLSNGWSTHQPVVEWLTGAFAIGALLLAVWLSFSPEALIPFLFLELFYLYQTIASSALLNLNYPSVYRSFTLNFAWAMGLFSSTKIQNSINNMRHRTGGSLADSSSGPAVGFVNRGLSPYNAQPADQQSLVARATKPTFQFIQRLLLGPGANAAFSTSTVQGEVQTVTADSSNVLQAGVPIYVNSVNISTANAFMTIFLDIAMLSAIAIAAFALIYFVLFFLAKKWNPRKYNLTKELLESYPGYVKAWVLRLGMVILFPSLIFIFYQWTLKDSWLSILFSILTLAAILSLLGYPIISTLRFARVSYTSSIYSHRQFFTSHGPLYARYKVSRFYFFLPTILAVVLKSLFISFAKARGDAQVIGILIIEGLLLLSLCALRPFGTRREAVFSVLQAIVRLVCTILLVAFLEELGVDAIKRVVFGFVIIVIFSLAVLFAIGCIAIELFFGGISVPVPSSSATSEDSLHDFEPDAMEKDRSKPSDSWDPEKGLGRPINPTPDHAVPLDHGCLPPHDFSPTTSPTSSTEPSGLSNDSGTTTVGSLLSRTWSFSLSAPGSPTGSSAQAFQTMSELSSSPHTPHTTSSHYSDEQSGTSAFVPRM